MDLRRASMPVGLVVAAVALAAWTAPATATSAPGEPAPAAPADATGEPSGADEDLVTFGIGPASGDRADQRPFITYGVAPGAVVFDSVAVINQSDETLDLVVYAADGVSAEGGGLDVRERAQTNTDLGSWVTIADEAGPVTVTVPPQSSDTGRGEIVLPIQIAVPQNATPGDHIGGVVASLITVGENPESQNIELEQRVAARIYLRVDGPLQPGLDVDVLDVAYQPGSNVWRAGSADVTYRVTNSGNTRLGVAPSITVAGPFAVAATGVDGDAVEELVPNGGTATLTTTVDGVWPLSRMSATVEVVAVPAPGAEQFDATAADTTRFWALHWQVFVLAGLLLLGVILLVVVRRRRRRGDGDSEGRRGDSRPPTDIATEKPQRVG
jgi:LPXTG-motif cell wall-anchored protein